MNTLTVKSNLLELTCDPEVVKYEGQFYIIINKSTKYSTIVLRSDYEMDIEQILKDNL